MLRSSAEWVCSGSVAVWEHKYMHTHVPAYISAQMSKTAKVWGGGNDVAGWRAKTLCGKKEEMEERGRNMRTLHPFIHVHALERASRAIHHKSPMDKGGKGGGKGGIRKNSPSFTFTLLRVK